MDVASRIRLSIRRRSRAAGDGRPGEAPATLGELETPGRRERLRSFRAPALVIVSPERGIAPVGDLRRSSVQYNPAVWRAYEGGNHRNNERSVGQMGRPAQWPVAV